jgi:hypothetical protein
MTCARGWVRNLVLVFMVVVAAPVMAQGRVHFVGVAAWDEHVFRSEVSGAQSVVASTFGAAGSTTLANGWGERVTAGTLTATLRATGARMNRDRDVLFLFLTSHGDRGRGVALRQGSVYGHLPPGAVRSALSAAGIRNAVVVVSACYSGIYTALASPNTLVITAARSDRASFGCRPGNTWTYFGRAFFAESLSRTRSLRRAFASARGIVARQERAERLVPSEPQMAGGRQVLALLDGQTGR